MPIPTINRNIAKYLCHMDGDSYADKISEEDAAVLNQIDKIEEIEHAITRTVQFLICTLKNGDRIKIRLYTNPDGDFRHYADFKIFRL